MSSGKPKKIPTQKQLDALRKYAVRPGEIRNPNGARAHNQFALGLKRITSVEYADIIEFALNHDITALRKMSKDAEIPAIKLGVAKALLKAIEDSNWGVLNAIVERLVGKQIQEIKVQANVTNDYDLSAFSDEDLAKLKEIIAKNSPQENIIEAPIESPTGA
jgi:hypothetical protein